MNSKTMFLVNFCIALGCIIGEQQTEWDYLDSDELYVRTVLQSWKN
jgi:hypothetical protein